MKARSQGSSCHRLIASIITVGALATVSGLDGALIVAVRSHSSTNGAHNSESAGSGAVSTTVTKDPGPSPAGSTAKTQKGSRPAS